jgi:hypothetical protein
MKKIILIMALFGLTFQFLSAGTMYKKLEGGESFDTTADNFSDAFYTVGVTTMRSLDDGLETWLFEAEKINPVIYLTITKAEEIGISLLSDGYYARDNSDTGGNTATWIQMTENTEAAAQYTGAPLFMQFDAWASTSTDYKGDDYQNGEVVLRFFPVLDLQRFADDGGAIIESWYRKNDETSWTQFTTKASGPNGHVVTTEDLWGDLNDANPVEITWDAKTDIPDFNGDISVRIRAKYGSAPFTTDPAPFVPSGTAPTPSAQFELDTVNPFNDFIDWDPAGSDMGITDLNGDGTADEKDKFQKVLSDFSLTPVGTYDAAGTDVPVYELDATAITNLTAMNPAPGFFVFTGNKLIRVKEATPSGS